MKILIYIVALIIVFSLGIFVGKVDFNLSNTDLGFLTMLGGWVSGLGALFAAMSSLCIAHISMRDREESLLTACEIQSGNKSLFTGQVSPDVFFLNLVSKSAARVELKSIELSFDNDNSSLNINSLRKGGKPLPFVFENKGHAEVFAFSFSDELGRRVWERIKQERGEDVTELKRGRIILTTTTRTFVVAMPDSYMESINKSFGEYLATY